MEDNVKSVEKALLMGIFSTNIGNDEIDYAMAELANLAEAANLEVGISTVQRRDKIEAATYIGSGKADELKMLAEDDGADVIIINTELSGAQIRNLTDICGVKIIDRTMLILDIFAKRAMSHIAKMQVELAMHRYRLPRLKGLGEEMSRMGAGIGTRGPGEQKLEIDRRRINEKMRDLETRLEEAEQKREVTKKARKKNEIKQVAIVGYTNAGKSSLMNCFIERYNDEADEKPVYVENMLFATLDTFHRKISISNKREFVLTDTVGFISDLPHELVKAFRSTLEVALESDLVLHIIDSSNPRYAMQFEAARSTLDRLGVDRANVLCVYNKIDSIVPDFEKIEDGMMISVNTGEGIDELKAEILARLYGKNILCRLCVPFDKGALLQDIMNRTSILNMSYEEDGTHIECELSESAFEVYKANSALKITVM